MTSIFVHGQILAAEIHQTVSEMQQLFSHRPIAWIDPYLIALVHTCLGEKDAAFEWLGKAYDARFP
jgi:hypothetical protein